VLVLTGAGRYLMNRGLFLARYEAVAAQGSPEQAYRLLLNPDAPLPGSELSMLRVQAADRVGNSADRDAHLKELLRSAADNPVRIRRAAELAERYSSRAALEVADDGWRRLAARPEDAGDAWQRLQRLADRRGDTWTARDYARRALRAGADSPELRLQVVHYDLLLDEDLDRASAEAEKQVLARPDDFFARCVAALGRLRLGSPEDARAILDRVVVPGRARGDGLAVVVATYGANGQEGKARELAAQIPLQALRPEERELIRPWLLPPPDGATLPAPGLP